MNEVILINIETGSKRMKQTGPKIFLQCLNGLEQQESKAKHCREMSQNAPRTKKKTRY